MANERITENLVRDTLRVLGYGTVSNETIVEEQKSQIAEVNKMLRGASKTGGKGMGAPEFIVSSFSAPDFLIIFECKALTKQHESPMRNRPVEFAVDGVLHYAKALSKSFNVIAVAASGQNESELKISNFLWPKGSVEYKSLTNEHGVEINSIIPFDDYIKHGSFDPIVSRNRHEDLMAFSRELHEFMRDHAKLTESEKPLLVSGTLIALKNTPFAKSFGDYGPEALQRQWMHVIKEEIEKADIPNSKKNSMTQPYSSISVHPELGKPTKKYPKGVMHELIKMLNEKVWPFVSVYHDFDVVGQFYGEFLKYTGGDKKALGIVLTPRHITELFALIANVQVDTKVLDICTGTGGFLISAMQQMMKGAYTDAQRNHIKQNCLVGVEQQPSMYALAASNMILRGDGKANLYQGNCFDSAITNAVKAHECSVGMINPPYAQSDESLHELQFVKHMLDNLKDGGIGIAIVPMSCAISPNTKRDELLAHHTLEAVMSMPDELFYPVGVITCIMVFSAGTSHAKSGKKTWFGYWKDDGFTKTKHKGRIDINELWPSIRDRWIEQYRNKEVHPGQSVSEYVTAADEWCAEAYMETDYSKITVADFESTVKNYAIFQLLGSALSNKEEDSADD
ncbi:N-6 DNA methylase [Escherichia coli]|uniref:HsdM family class I SAM-dependent methyltransferase n=1 Tax=Enterobacteriaceae TaxID=543 RepID=UPI0007918B55|nr:MULTISPECIES: N-6 DNA methylase [Enterobacteriaceae]EIN3418063.1 N-6 DNA methylase [Escherichia coli]HCB1629160.1 N-6 DNA methylase [Enterobacter kobei]HCT3689849.1 N-6 DNA methylase [Enterobacter hormaechei]EKF7063593.1 N-6 DNA methylase [Escherichia coli]EKF7119193.1 N-6 DNA methylase [Escherichia coli]